MTSTPISLNDDSSSGSWIDINSASQIHSPLDDDGAEFITLATDSAQNAGLIPFQVQRFLQEAQRNQGSSGISQQNVHHQSQNQQPTFIGIHEDNNSGIYLSDTDISVGGFDSKALIKSLRKHHQRSMNESNNNDPHSKSYNLAFCSATGQRLCKSADGSFDQLSDSLSFLSRASAISDAVRLNQTKSLQEFDWLWDWTAEPEYFSGQEWKVYTPKQEYLMRQRQMYCATNKNPDDNLFSGEVVSLLFLTNILSIIIGAGLTYSILMRKYTV